MNRRAFYLTFIYGLWACIGMVMAIPAGVYLLFPPRPRKREPWTEAGSVSQLQPGTPVEWIFRRNRVDGWKVISEKTVAWVVKKSGQEILAFGPQCPHLGCAYSWKNDTRCFLCPCHTSTFSLDGEVLTGPAPRPLDRYEIKIDGDKLYLGEIHTVGEKSS